MNSQFTRQKLHISNPDQLGNTNANGLSTMSKEKEDFTIFCPLCLIYFNSRKSYTDHQSVCFDTFHHNELFRLEQNEKIHQFCNSVPRSKNLFGDSCTLILPLTIIITCEFLWFLDYSLIASRIPYQSSTGGRVFSFVRYENVWPLFI